MKEENKLFIAIMLMTALMWLVYLPLARSLKWSDLYVSYYPIVVYLVVKIFLFIKLNKMMKNEDRRCT